MARLPDARRSRGCARGPPEWELQAGRQNKSDNRALETHKIAALNRANLHSQAAVMHLHCLSFFLFACAAAAQGRSDAAASHCEPKTGGAELFFAVSTATPAIRHAKVIKPIRYHVMAAPPVMHRKRHAGSGDQQ